MDKKPYTEAMLESSPIDEVLCQARELVKGDRQQDYGDATENFSAIAAGWAVIFKDGVTPERVGLAMTWLKICRELNAHKVDNLVDAAGYLALVNLLNNP